MTTLRTCDCGSHDVELKRMLQHVWVACNDCMAEGKVYNLQSRVGDLWPADAAIKAWNSRVFQPEE